MADIGRPQVKRRLPVVLSQAEVLAVLAHLEGTHRLLAQLLYGTGLRITEALQLRVKDLDFDHGAVIVREGIYACYWPTDDSKWSPILRWA